VGSGGGRSSGGMLEWYSAYPDHGILAPGELVEIKLCVLVQDGLARLLATGEERLGLDDILILRVDGGKDSFVTVKARYAMSAFGCSLETLVHCPGAARG
ncbi:unnamed protein product, partial [Discosporangium mesarthrocarpum]